jgi:hypothetical protein
VAFTENTAEASGLVFSCTKSFNDRLDCVMANVISSTIWHWVGHDSCHSNGDQDDCNALHFEISGMLKYGDIVKIYIMKYNKKYI